MVDDPSAHPDLFPTEKAQEKERQRLFKIMEDLVLWENTGHPLAKELLTGTSCPLFTTPLPMAAPCPWSPRGWAWKPMQAI